MADIGLFGQLAIQKGFVTEEQLQLCLKVQAQLGGRHHLGALLINRGFINEDQLKQILALQKAHEERPASKPPPVAKAITDPPPSQGPSRITALLESAEKRAASDVHFHPGNPVAMRAGGRLLVTTQPPLVDAELRPQLLGLLSAKDRELLEKEQSLDALITTPSGLRTRANFYFTHSGLNATFRLIRRAPPTLEELGLPRQLASFVSHSQGLVLVAGLAGSGKTSTLAALVNLIAEERAEHVLSLEDPIEIVHPPKKALVNQRQVGRDTESFARALRGALREDPDVIVIGELRDSETISLAVTAAETGHLVIGSMNTATSSRAISRILAAFPPAQQAQVRAMVSESLHGVITQRLVPTVDGDGRRRWRSSWSRPPSPTSSARTSSSSCARRSR